MLIGFVWYCSTILLLLMGVKYIVFYFFMILAFVIFAFISPIAIGTTDTMLKSMKKQALRIITENIQYNGKILFKHIWCNIR